MVGTLINAMAILLGSAVGLLLRKGMKQAIADTVMQGLSLCVLLIGLKGALQSQHVMLVILSMVVGGVIGSLLDIEERMNQLGIYAQRKIERAAANNGAKKGLPADNAFAKGFVTASLVFCVGAMAVVGALDSGIRGDHSTLLAKSALDGVAAVVFASTLGAGVVLSALSVFVYQGAIALLGHLIAPLVSAPVVQEMSAVGGLLIVGLGLNMLLQKDIKVANLLPAIFVPFVYFAVQGWIGK